MTEQAQEPAFPPGFLLVVNASIEGWRFKRWAAKGEVDPMQVVYLTERGRLRVLEKE